LKTVKELLQSNDIRPITLFFENGTEISGLFSEFRVHHHTDTESKYLYDIRHTDEYWCEPATLEKRVMVNWFGTLIVDEPIEILESDNGAYLEITDYGYDED
jgi:hypothetical protein